MNAYLYWHRTAELIKNRLIKNFEVFFQKQSHFKDHLKIIGGKKEKRDL